MYPWGFPSNSLLREKGGISKEPKIFFNDEERYQTDLQSATRRLLITPIRPSPLRLALNSNHKIVLS